MSGDSDLAAMIAAARASYGLDARELAKRAAPVLGAAIKATAAAGTTPDGKPWPARKDGGRALVHAADHIESKAIGTVVQVTLTGPDVWHHYGGRVPRRQIIPDGGAAIPKSVFAALEAACAASFHAATGGAR